MRRGVPSRTAWGAASHRAAHQLLENGQIFSDPLAVRILGEPSEAIVRDAQDPSRLGMRWYIAARTRFAEDTLALAVERGVLQFVVLGAGLDTYAYRGSMRDRLRIFEVDRPAIQLWKRELLDNAGMAIPNSLTFAPIDFERQTLSDGLAAAGFLRHEQAFFTWLGVVPYLSEEAVLSTLQFIAGLRGARVVFDYSDPPESFEGEARINHLKRAARVAAIGEPWLSYFQPDELHAQLASLGFLEIEDLGPQEIARRYFPGNPEVRAKGGHVLFASTI